MTIQKTTSENASVQKPQLVSAARGLRVGDPFPHFHQNSNVKKDFAVDTMAGRYLVFCFLGSISSSAGQLALNTVLNNRDLFDDNFSSFFAVTVDRADQTPERVHRLPGGMRLLWDFDLKVSRLCRAISPERLEEGKRTYFRHVLVVDPTLHVLKVFPFSEIEAVCTFLRRLPQPQRFAGFTLPPPILILPNVLEAELCHDLIDAYETHGGEDSGVMQHNRGVYDHAFKRRRDHQLVDARLINAAHARLTRRVAPELERLFFFKTKYIERFLVGCYAAEDDAHFGPHRDNSFGITAHRRFAVSINLNDEFDGGGVYFPEYSAEPYKGPPGWAVVFPCAVLHAVARVTSGRRYAFLPFIYDEDGARIRQEWMDANIRARSPAT